MQTRLYLILPVFSDTDRPYASYAVLKFTLQNKPMQLTVYRWPLHRYVLSKARKLFVADKLQFDDFRELKKEHQSVFNSLKKELNTVTSKLQRIDQQFKLADRPLVDIFRGFVGWDTADKREIVNLISPTNVNIQTGELSIKMDNALLKILSLKRASQPLRK